MGGHESIPTPAEVVIAKAALEVQTMVMSEFERLSPDMRPLPMAPVDTSSGVNLSIERCVSGKDIIVSGRHFPDRGLVVLTEYGLKIHDEHMTHMVHGKGGRRVPRELDEWAKSNSSPPVNTMLWLSYGACAMGLLRTEESYQQWLRENPDTPQVARDAQYVHSFGLDHRDFGDDTGWNTRSPGRVGAMERFGYSREEALEGWLAIGIDIEAAARQQEEERYRQMSRTLFDRHTAEPEV